MTDLKDAITGLMVVAPWLAIQQTLRALWGTCIIKIAAAGPQQPGWEWMYTVVTSELSGMEGSINSRPWLEMVYWSLFCYCSVNQSVTLVCLRWFLRLWKRDIGTWCCLIKSRDWSVSFLLFFTFYFSLWCSSFQVLTFASFLTVEWSFCSGIFGSSVIHQLITWTSTWNTNWLQWKDVEKDVPATKSP